MATFTSKFLVTLVLGLIYLSNGYPVPAFANGSSSGGGGSLQTATPAEVREAVTQLLEQDGKGSITEYLFYVQASLQAIREPEVKAVLTKILNKVAPNRSWPKNIWKGTYIFETEGPCNGTDGAQQASVSSNEIGSTICYSLPLLSKIPRVQLNAALIALTAHEISHQFGADESLAKKVEVFFSGWVLQVKSVMAIEFGFQQIQVFIQGDLSKLEKDEQLPIRSAACMEFGSIVGRSTALDMPYLDLTPATGVEHSKEVDVAYYQAYWFASLPIQAFCYNSEQPRLSAPEKQKLISYYKGLQQVVEKVRNTFPIRD